MCNLYRLTTPAQAIGRLFRAETAHGANLGEEVYPGYPGLVVAEGRLRTMTWGFPLALKSQRTGEPLKPKPVNNTREDKLLTPFWRDSFVHRRCLIPVSAWAEAEGETGRMTRTWYSLPGDEPFAVAGLWRPTAEWGHAYSMVMVDGCADMAEVHDRMPTILAREDWDQWRSGTSQEAMELCHVWQGPLAVKRTQQSWAQPRGTVARLI